MNRIKTKILNAIGEWAIWYIGRYTPERLTGFVNERARELASETAVRVSMEYMNRQGMLHCAFCAQRFGLRYTEIPMDGEEIKRVLVCQAHYAANQIPKKQAEAIR